MVNLLWAKDSKDKIFAFLTWQYKSSNNDIQL